MRIVLDLQGAQGANAKRGIGRYTLSLARAIVRNRGEHEVMLALNGLFPDTIEPIRAEFDGLLSQDNIRVWQAVGPVKCLEPENHWRRKSAEMVREAFLANLEPDILYVGSVFDGLLDDTIVSIGALSRTLPTAVTLYDLIPLIYPESYLQNQVHASCYADKLDHFRRADLWLAISGSAGREGIERLGLPENSVVNISSAADACFRPLKSAADDVHALRQKYRLTRPFIMYTGGIDYRKNIEGLIRSYARLPVELRHAHQLAIVCAVQPHSHRMFEQLAGRHGLKQGEVVLTGYVPEDDLVTLYNACKLFVFPSWHEGFGIPALEAMSCGAPVIAADTSSLPEVIGRADALFDPFDEDAIAAKMAEALTNDAFRAELSRHGLEQSKKFSWDESARRAIAAFERFHENRLATVRAPRAAQRRPRLAYVSPLPPERSGIADYSAQLLRELSRHYEIDVIVAQQQVSDPWVKGCCNERSIDWFIANAERYDRVLYHFGNSVYHQHMVDLLNRVPGVVVLHDFFIGHMLANREATGSSAHAWSDALYRSHGYAALRERFENGAAEAGTVAFKYPCNLGVLQQARGIIVHSDYSRQLADQWYGSGWAADWSVIPLLRAPANQDDHDSLRRQLDLNVDDFVVCSFGLIGPTKQNHRLLKAWLSSSLAADPRCKLIFVGGNDGGQYGQSLLDAIRESGHEDRVTITGWADASRFQAFLAAADMTVQLRTLSRGETSAAILDCMNNGLPAIVNANGSIGELPADGVWRLEDDFEDADLTGALETLWRNEEKRKALGARARELIQTKHSPRACADQYARAIETYYDSAVTDRHALVKAVAELDSLPENDDSWVPVAEAIAQNMPLQRPLRQLLVDISELVQRDAKSGIQRVVRSVLRELLTNPPDGYRVEPVYATMDRSGYCYARQFTLGFLNCPTDALNDAPIEAQTGDILLCLDLQHHVALRQADYCSHLRRLGVSVHFVVYDLVPITLPHAFPEYLQKLHADWLGVVSQADGAVCISRAVADELSEWLDAHGPQKRFRPFQIGWFHLGANLSSSVPTRGTPNNAAQVLTSLSERPTFLMVSTVEPRKGYAQALAAVETLWTRGADVNLVIVGKQGWKVEELVDKLRSHPERGQRLFWLEGVSDEYLEKIYAAATCLIAASEGEGFGLPLIEAAQHDLPVIARDIPVFREVAGDHAHYFAGSSDEDLADAVQRWLTLHERGEHPRSANMPRKTWVESAAMLKKVIIDQHWHRTWMPNQRRPNELDPEERKVVAL